MERLSSAYAYLWETCGPWGIALLDAIVSDDPTASEGFQVYADPAGHPFCLCWG